MYNDIISALSVCLNVFGTVFAVLCIIKMSFKDVMKTREAWRRDHKELDDFEQRYYARTGIGIIVIGGILQIFAIFFQNISLLECLIVSIAAVAFAIIIIMIEKNRMNAYKKRAKKENP